MNSAEHRLQAQCTQWFWNTYPEHRRMLLCIDNNSSNRVEGNMKKALGVVRGASDLILIGEFCVVFIELKVGDNKQSEYQKDFQEKVKARGHLYKIIRSFEEFKEAIWKTIGQF